jgi:hypothetical protein
MLHTNQSVRYTTFKSKEMGLLFQDTLQRQCENKAVCDDRCYKRDCIAQRGGA